MVGGRGSVTIMELFMGSSFRCSPGSWAVNPSVARTTQGARTSPRAVWTRPGSMRRAGVRSYMATPCRQTTSASPRTSLAGWIRAQWGLNTPPATPATASRSRTCSAPNSHSSSGPRPHVRSSARAARSRYNWAAPVATAKVPPTWMSASMPSLAHTSTISLTASIRWRCRPTTPARPPPGRPAESRASRARSPGMRPESQPPFRPLAPKPACSASSTTIRKPGSAPAKAQAVHSPV